MDKLFIQQLKITAIIGVLPEERLNPQDIYLDLEIGTDITLAARTDDLVHAIDYAALCQCVIDYISTTQFQLIETLAEKTVQHLFEFFPQVPWLRLNITKKPAGMPYANGAGISIERRRT